MNELQTLMYNAKPKYRIRIVNGELFIRHLQNYILPQGRLVCRLCRCIFS